MNKGRGDSMESTNSMPSEAVSGTAIEWRTQVPDDLRRTVVRMISDWAMKYVWDGQQDPGNIQIKAAKYEKKVFSEATSQDDYRRRICARLQMRPKESLPSPAHPVEHSMQQRPQESIPKSSPPSRAHPVEHSMQQRPQESIPKSSPPSRAHPVERSMQQRPQESIPKSSPPRRAHSVEHSMQQRSQESIPKSSPPSRAHSVEHSMQQRSQESIPKSSPPSRAHPVENYMQQRPQESIPKSSPPSRAHPVEHSMQQRPQESIPKSSSSSRAHPVERSMQQRPQESIPKSSPPSRAHPVEHSMPQRSQESIPKSSPPSRAHPVERSMQQRPQESISKSSPPSRAHSVEHSMQQRSQESIPKSSPPSRAHPVENYMQQRPQESIPKSSPPSRAHPVERSTHQAGPQPQLEGPGLGQSSEMQHGLQKHPLSVVKHSLPHQRPVIHDQGIQFNQQKAILKPQKNHLNAMNNQLNDQQRAVPDLLTQQSNLYALKNQSGEKMHQLGRQVKASTFNGQPRHIDMQSDQGNLSKVPKVEPRMQTQPVLLQTSVSQPGKQPTNIGIQRNQGDLYRVPKTQLWMQAQPYLPQTSGLQQGKQSSNIAMQTDQGNLLRVSKSQPQTQAQPAFLETLGSEPGKHQLHPYPMSQMHMQPQENNIQVMDQGESQEMHTVEDDWKENLFQKITNLKNVFLPALKVKYGELTNTLQMIGANQKTAEYEALKKKVESYRRMQVYLNFSRDKMTEEVLKWLPICEKSLNQLFQEKTQGHNPSPLQKILSTSDEQSMMVTSQVEDRQLQQLQMTETLAQNTKQGRLNHHQQSVELAAQHGSQFNKASNVNPMQGMGAGTGNDMQTKSLVNCSLINHQLLKSEPISTPDTNILDKSLGNLGHSSSPDRSEPSLNSGSDLRESSVPVEPIQRLIKVASSLSHVVFRASVRDMDSILQMTDKAPGQLAGSQSNFVVGDDLSGATTCRFGLLKQDVCSQTMQTNSYATAPKVRFFESGLINDGLNNLTDPEASLLESSIANHEATPRFEANANLLEEIRQINLKLIETVVEISHNDIWPGTSVSRAEGTVVKCSYTPVANSTFLPAIIPLRLLVPTNYPADSPMILNDLPLEMSEDLSAKAKSKLILSLQIRHQPWSLTDIIRTWDTCARAVITEFAQKFGGGSFSSTYGSWESYPSVS